MEYYTGAGGLRRSSSRIKWPKPFEGEVPNLVYPPAERHLAPVILQHPRVPSPYFANARPDSVVYRVELDTPIRITFVTCTPWSLSLAAMGTATVSKLGTCPAVCFTFSSASVEAGCRRAFSVQCARPGRGVHVHCALAALPLDRLAMIPEG